MSNKKNTESGGSSSSEGSKKPEGDDGSNVELPDLEPDTTLKVFRDDTEKKKDND